MKVPELFPVEYALPAPWRSVHACYCSGLVSDREIRPPFWYLNSPAGYWREGDGWADSTPTQFCDPIVAAGIFLAAMAQLENQRSTEPSVRGTQEVDGA